MNTLNLYIDIETKLCVTLGNDFYYDLNSKLHHTTLHTLDNLLVSMLDNEIDNELDIELKNIFVFDLL